MLTAVMVVVLLAKSFWGLVFFVKIITSKLIVILSHRALSTACTHLHTVEFIVVHGYYTSAAFHIVLEPLTKAVIIPESIFNGL